MISRMFRVAKFMSQLFISLPELLLFIVCCEAAPKASPQSRFVRYRIQRTLDTIIAAARRTAAVTEKVPSLPCNERNLLTPSYLLMSNLPD
jgi:hypothetical protein